MISFFIPIRKNSKRIKNKNIKKILNYKYGLTEIKINQLRKFKILASRDKFLKKIKFEFIISTDDMRLEKFINKFKWLNFVARPKSLSKDNCLDELIKYVPKICNGEHILWTHVTSPFYDQMCYVNFVKYYLNNLKKFDSCFTADKISTFIYNKTKKNWISHNRKKIKWPRTQDLDSIYKVNHAAFLSKRSVYTKINDRIGLNPLPMSLAEQSLKTFDIDEEKDFNFFKKILIKKK
ncbi:MAG: hypothetical protein CBC33_000060 [Coraliomargarita sp. TMED73]|nr:MAG: hypothetical protein CBC33_000060 [Coraliomargarita sp. TMED73]|tara:strand:- start:5367 stop:6074 length:708 start_codon:yes stop_codon:yes gene_type:complete